MHTWHLMNWSFFSGVIHDLFLAVWPSSSSGIECIDSLHWTQLIWRLVTICRYTVFYVISHPGQLSFLPSAVTLCGWGVKANVAHSACG